MAKTSILPLDKYVLDLLDYIIENGKIEAVSSEYCAAYAEKRVAAKALIKDFANQATCAAIVEQVAPLLKLPEFVDASLGFIGLVYYQLFLVCGVAAIAGKDIHGNQVKTQCVECITVNMIARVLRIVASKVVTVLLERYKHTGMEKGIDSLVEFILDWGAIKIVGKRAYKAFIQ